MTITAMLLTGGRSRRMGQDKAGVIIAGGALWQRQLRVLRELGPEALWVSARTRPPWCPPEIEVVVDKPPSRGPLSGLAAGLGRSQTSHLLALAIDLPRISTEHLGKLWGQTRSGAGVIPQQDDYFEPLCGIYPAIAQEALNASDASLQSCGMTGCKRIR
jgi:molybdopterin-guanine dinucleotide biosynthesis protein A